MTSAEQMRNGRARRGWGQARAAAEFGVSQPYLSLLEGGARPVPEHLARRAARLYRLSATALPLATSGVEVHAADPDDLPHDLAVLGYPGFAHLRASRRPAKNPAEILIAALRAGDLDGRLVEALPWVVLRFPDLDWQWLVAAAKLNDAQNRLGFVIGVARTIAETSGEHDTAELLREREAELEKSRLAGEGTLCCESLSMTERRWLRERRSAEARHWNLLTDLAPEHIAYGA